MLISDRMFPGRSCIFDYNALKKFNQKRLSPALVFIGLLQLFSQYICLQA